MSHTVVFIFPSPSDSVFLSLGGGGRGGWGGWVVLFPRILLPLLLLLLLLLAGFLCIRCVTDCISLLLLLALLLSCASGKQREIGMWRWGGWQGGSGGGRVGREGQRETVDCFSSKAKQHPQDDDGEDKSTERRNLNRKTETMHSTVCSDWMLIVYFQTKWPRIATSPTGFYIPFSTVAMATEAPAGIGFNHRLSFIPFQSAIRLQIDEHPSDESSMQLTREIGRQWYGQPFPLFLSVCLSVCLSFFRFHSLFFLCVEFLHFFTFCFFFLLCWLPFQVTIHQQHSNEFEIWFHCYFQPTICY